MQREGARNPEGERIDLGKVGDRDLEEKRTKIQREKNRDLEWEDKRLGGLGSGDREDAEMAELSKR